MATVDAIIFLAPISGFDQVLSEDKTVNRLVGYYFKPFGLSSHTQAHFRKILYYYGKQFVQINCSPMLI